MPKLACLLAILVAMAMLMPPAFATEGAQAQPSIAAAVTVSSQPLAVAAPAADAGKSVAAAQAPAAGPVFLPLDFDEQPLLSAFVFVGTLLAAMTIFGRIRRDDPPAEGEWRPGADVTPVSRDAPPATRVDGI